MERDYAPGNMRGMNDAYCEIDWPADAGGEALQAAFTKPVETLVAWRAEEVGPLLTRAEALAGQGCWLVGFVAYEAASAFDAALAAHAAPEGMPLAMFAAFAEQSPLRPRHEFLTGIWRDTTSDAAFDEAVGGIRADIAEGRFYQVNYTTRLRALFLGDSAALFDALRSAQPGSHAIHLDFGRWQICSVSPELFFRWSNGEGVPRRLALRPMKGTAPRHADNIRDRQAAHDLRASEKERAENLMIVDLLRNDASRVARLGSVEVPALFSVEPWSTVWQMTSTVECETRPEVGLAEVFSALFPCGSVTGAPKTEAMRGIVELEREPRGVYCGALGVIMPGGEARFSVGIRTVTVDKHRGMAECGIGSGIVLDSTAEGEGEEWRAKQRFLRRACPDYELLETMLWRRGRYWLREEHLARLESSALALGFAWDRVKIEAAMDEAASEFGDGRWRVRLTLAGDGTATVRGEPMQRMRGPVKASLATQAVDSANPWLRHKTTRRGLYESLAVPGAFDTLLHNERGEATEFTRGNLVVKMNGRLLTPAVSCGLLPGTFRATLLARGVVEEAIIRVDDLPAAEALWFVNSVRGAVRSEWLQWTA